MNNEEGEYKDLTQHQKDFAEHIRKGAKTKRVGGYFMYCRWCKLDTHHYWEEGGYVCCNQENHKCYGGK